MLFFVCSFVCHTTAKQENIIYNGEKIEWLFKKVFSVQSFLFHSLSFILPCWRYNSKTFQVCWLQKWKWCRLIGPIFIQNHAHRTHYTHIKKTLWWNETNRKKREAQEQSLNPLLCWPMGMWYSNRRLSFIKSISFPPYLYTMK